MFLALIRSDALTREMAKVVLYGAAERPSHSIDVFVSRIRSKTRRFGVAIETINRTGYRLVDRLAWTKALKLDAVEQN